MAAISVLICALVFSKVTESTEQHWQYIGRYGQQNWGKKYPTCNGKSQSPISISQKDIKYRKGPFITFQKYDSPPKSMTLKNDCNALKLVATWESKELIPSVVFDQGNYTFDCLYFHWGKDDTQGSEHIIDGQQYAMEMQIVHKSKDNKMLVLSMLFVICMVNVDLPALPKVVGNLKKVRENYTSTSVTGVQLEGLVAASKIWNDFYWYVGSLTLPPCTENVNWCLASDGQCVTRAQISEFRQLRNSHKGFISGNIRIQQKINERIVYHINPLGPGTSTSEKKNCEMWLATLFVTFSMMLLIVAR